MTNHSSDLDALKQDPTAAALMKDPAVLKGLLSSPEAMQLMQLLRQKGGSSLNGAAHAAAQGNPAALMGLLNQVTSSEEGARTVKQLKHKAEHR